MAHVFVFGIFLYQGGNYPRSVTPPGRSPQPSRQSRRTGPRRPVGSLGVKTSAIGGAVTPNHHAVTSVSSDAASPSEPTGRGPAAAWPPAGALASAEAWVTEVLDVTNGL